MRMQDVLYDEEFPTVQESDKHIWKCDEGRSIVPCGLDDGSHFVHIYLHHTGTLAL